MAFMRAAHDASHKSHALYGTISVGCTKKSFLKQLRGKTKEETLLKQTQNFSCTQKHFFFLNKQVLDQEKNVIGNHRNHRSLAVCVASRWLPCTRCVLAPTRVFFCIALELGMKTDGNGWENPQLFLFPYFIKENGNRSRIGGNGSENGIYRLWKWAGTGKFTGMHYCLITIYPGSI